MKPGYDKYKATSIQSASREKLLLMLYEGAIKFTKRAIIACENKNIAERGVNIGRVYDIIIELQNTLNYEVGKEIAQNLDQLYMFITERLTTANIKGETPPLKDVLKILEILHDGWVQAVEKIKRGEVRPSASGMPSKS